MTLFCERTVGPERAGKSGAVPDRLPFVANARHALSLDRPPRACRPGKRFPEQLSGRFRGFGNNLLNPLRTIHFALLLCAAVILPGCATLKSALMPTPVACAPKDSPTPPKVTANSLLAKMDDYHLILVIGSERNELITYSAKADAIIKACQ